jgi:hypothetical protein
MLRKTCGKVEPFATSQPLKRAFENAGKSKKVKNYFKQTM